MQRARSSQALWKGVGEGGAVAAEPAVGIYVGPPKLTREGVGRQRAVSAGDNEEQCGEGDAVA